MPPNPLDFLTQYKNELFNQVQLSDFSVTDFNAYHQRNKFILQLIDTPMMFFVTQKIDSTEYLGNWQQLKVLQPTYTRFAKGFPMITPKTERESFRQAGLRLPTSYYYEYPLSIEYVCTELNYWLIYDVTSYLEFVGTPDNWAELKSIQPFYTTSTFTTFDFEHFTDHEKEEIRAALSNFKVELNKLRHEFKTEIDQVHERIDYIHEALERLNRFDWKGVAISTVIGIATNMTVDVNTGNKILEIFRQVFGKAIKYLPPG